jgi:hypothetical protein
MSYKIMGLTYTKPKDPYLREVMKKKKNVWMWEGVFFLSEHLLDIKNEIKMLKYSYPEILFEVYEWEQHTETLGKWRRIEGKL